MELHAVQRVLAVADGFHQSGLALGDDHEYLFQVVVAGDDLLVAFGHPEPVRESRKKRVGFVQEDLLFPEVNLGVFFHQGAE